MPLELGGGWPCCKMTGKKDGVKRQEKRKEVCRGERRLLTFLLLLPVSFGARTAFQDYCLSQVMQTDLGCPLGGTEICRLGYWQMPPCPKDGQSLLLCTLRLRELCVKLMFLHPVDYGRKAEELLWRKVYYEVIQLIKTNKKVRGGPRF